jgi:hypothetical protein
MTGDSLVEGLLLALFLLKHHVMYHHKINTSPYLCCRNTKCAADRRSVLTYTKKSNKIYCTALSLTQIYNDISKVPHTAYTASCEILRPHISGKRLNAGHEGHPRAKESKPGTPQFESVLMASWEISAKPGLTMWYTILIFCYLTPTEIRIVLQKTWRFKTSAFLICQNGKIAGPTLTL